jgi:hypothetical protein
MLQYVEMKMALNKDDKGKPWLSLNRDEVTFIFFS